MCPCKNNSQTDQPAINCSLCHGQRYFYFLPELGLENYAVDAYGNPIEINEERNAVLIQAAITGITKQQEVFERFGQWLFGTANCTTQAPNRLGYGDRLVLADSTMSWQQTIDCDGTQQMLVTHGKDRHGLRYRVIRVNMLRSLTTVYQELRDYRVLDRGLGIEWLINPPATGTQLAIHYLVHPVYRVASHSHSFRDTLISFKKPKNVNKRNQHTELPTSALLKLDFLFEADDA